MKLSLHLTLAAGAGEVTNLYSVNYNTNNSTGGTTPPTQSASSDSATYTFRAPSGDEYGLVKTGYGFAGWSENPSANLPEYASGATITLTNNNPNKTLYAVWLNWTNVTTMQLMSPGICTSASIGETKQLTDSRDNKTYWIARLADGNCWMTQNLDLDLNGVTLTPSDSDVSSNWTSTTGASNLWNSTNQNDIKYYDPGLKFCNASVCNLTSSTNDGHDAQGNYYSFNAATAGSGQNANQNAVDSICPKGWKLPLSSNNIISDTAASGSFGKVFSYYNITTSSDTNLLKSPFYFVRSGYAINGSLSHAGTEGRYWSSTTNNASEAYYLLFHSSHVGPSYSDHRYIGYPIRCVTR